VLIIPIITCDGYWSNVFSYHQQFFLRGWYGLVIQASLIGDFTMKHMGTTFKHDGWWLGAILPFENSSVGDIMGYVMDNSHNGVQEPCCLMFSIIVIEWGFNHERWWLNQIKLWYTGNLLWFLGIKHMGIYLMIMVVWELYHLPFIYWGSFVFSRTRISVLKANEFFMEWQRDSFTAQLAIGWKPRVETIAYVFFGCITFLMAGWDIWV
jgi:hypothetical protein